MGLENVQEKANTTYYGYNDPDEPKENYQRLKKNDFVEGYFHGSYSRDGKFGKQQNHVLIQVDGSHHVIPGSKDVDTRFNDNAKVGLFTRYTYEGKKSFEYTDDKGGKGSASAIQGLIQQDKDKTCSFSGDKYAVKVVIGGSKEASDTPNSDLTTDDVPF